MKVLIAIPTYNERENIEALVHRVRSAVPLADILIVDDNSPDGTGDIADSLAQNDSQIHVLHRLEKDGLARAYIAAFTWAGEKGYTHVVEMDADGSHHPEELPRLLDRAAASDAPDLVIGSRYVDGGKIEGWAQSRVLLSKMGNLYIKGMLGMPFSDVTAGYRVYALSVFERLDLQSVDTVGYYFQADMTNRLYRMGAKIVEVPITFTERVAGESKLSGAIFTESLRKVTFAGVNHRTTQLTHAGRRGVQKLTRQAHNLAGKVHTKIRQLRRK